MRRRARFIVIKCQHDRKPAISSYLKFFQLRKLAAAYRGHLAGSLVIILFPLFRIVPNIFVRGWQSSRSTRVMFRRSKIVSSQSWLVVHTRCWKKEKILNVMIDRSCEQSHPFDVKSIFTISNIVNECLRFYLNKGLIRKYVSSRISMQSYYFKKNEVRNFFASIAKNSNSIPKNLRYVIDRCTSTISNIILDDPRVICSSSRINSCSYSMSKLILSSKFASLGE